MGLFSPRDSPPTKQRVVHLGGVGVGAGGRGHHPPTAHAQDDIDEADISSGKVNKTTYFKNTTLADDKGIT